LHIGIFGLSNSGKTTVFNASTRGNAEVASYVGGLILPNIGTVKVPDERLEKLSKIYLPKKTVPAEVTYTDVPGLTKGMSSGNDQQAQTQIFTHLRNAEALLHVVRAFEDENVSHPDDSVDPIRDIDTAEIEFMIADLGIIEKRLKRIDRDIRKLSGTDRDRVRIEEQTLRWFQELLESETPLRAVEMSDDQEKVTRGYRFLSQKPQLILFNVGEENREDERKLIEMAHEKFQTSGQIPGKIPSRMASAICGKLEMELAQMEEEDAALFMDDLGIDEPGLNKMIRLSYRLLGVCSFFTVGADEVRAWTISENTPAQKAAGEIHSDLERGFIRAEVIRYQDHIKYGSIVEAKKRGVVRLEGKDYIVRDGDIMNIRFNV